MGYEKRRYYDALEAQWTTPNEYVCIRCVGDEYLAKSIRAASEDETCSYCKGEGDEHVVASLDVLLDVVVSALNHYWNDPADELPYCSAEGGYQGAVRDTADLFAEIGEDWPDSLLSDVVNSINQEAWCDRDYARLRPVERLTDGWKSFVETVKHSSRYVVLRPLGATDVQRQHPDEVPPSTMLDEVVQCMRDCDLFTCLPARTPLVRARTHDTKKKLETAADLGAPTPDQARSPNRMSAAGIAVFYGAMDARTAVIETIGAESSLPPAITACTFHTTRNLNVLNLCDMPPFPSFWDVSQSGRRSARSFLAGFVDDVSRPVVKDGAEHVDYVPTQVFAEFIRHCVRLKNGEPVHGVMYPSAQTDGRCCVLFCDQSACGTSFDEAAAVESGLSSDSWLCLDARSIHRVDVVDCIADRLVAASSVSGSR